MSLKKNNNKKKKKEGRQEGKDQRGIRKKKKKVAWLSRCHGWKDKSSPLAHSSSCSCSNSTSLSSSSGESLVAGFIHRVLCHVLMYPSTNIRKRPAAAGQTRQSKKRE